MVASRPILTSEREGPIRGTLIMGRFLNSAEISRLGETTELTLSVHPPGDSNTPPIFKNALSSPPAEPPINVFPVNQDLVAGYTLINDIYGKPGLLLKVELPRSIYKQGQASILYFVVSLLAAGLVFGLINLLLLEKTVLSRLARLNDSVSAIGSRSDHTARVQVTGRDELSSLGEAVNGMLEALDLSRRELGVSEERYRDLVENSPDLIFSLNSKGEVTSISQWGWEYFEFNSATEFLGKHYSEFIHPDNRAMAAKTLQRLIFVHRKIDKGLSFKMVKKSGKTILAELNSSLLYDEHGNYEGMFGTIRDVTERKRAEEKLKLSEQRLEALLGLNQMKESALVDITGFALREGVRLTGSDFGFLALINDDLTVSKMYSWSKQSFKECILTQKPPVDLLADTGPWGEAARQKRLVTINQPMALDPRDIGCDQDPVHLLRLMNIPVLDGDRVVMVAGVGNKKEDYDRSDAHQLTLLMAGLWKIIQRKKSEEQIIFQASLLDQVYNAVIATDLTGRIVYWNKFARSLYQWRSEEVIGKNVMDLLLPSENRKVSMGITKTLKATGFWEGEILTLRKDGSRFVSYAVNAVLKDTSGNPTGAVGVTIDITERKRVEEELNLQKAYFQQLFENSPEGIAMLDNQDAFITVNRGFERLFQYTAEEIRGRRVNDIIVPESLLEESVNLSREVYGGQAIQAETLRMRKDGSLINVLAVAYPILLTDKQAGMYVIYSDITERKQAEDQLKYLSLHDPLTGLYNRAYFEQEMKRLQGGRWDPVGVLLCDVDGLKLVNDTMGHDVGDTLLITASRIIKEAFRGSDMVARIGGDEFAVLLPNSDKKAVFSAAERVREAISSHNATNPDIPMSISIGYITGNTDSKNMSDLFKEADNNMYREKLLRSQSTRSSIVQTLMKAMEARDFVTEGHADRLQELVSGLGKSMGLSERNITDLRLLAQFHDIGKVGIPDRILFKPGPLSPEEKNEMLRHSEIGHRIAQSAPDLAHIADWILKHHEWWDGKGYPLGLKGEGIPLECRVLAIADAYDAMTNNRPYRTAMSHQDAVKELLRCAGTQFDPNLVSMFILVLEINNIKQ